MNPATILAQPTMAYLGQIDWQWALLIYNTSGQLVDIPQNDIESIEVEDVINGGSGQGTIVFRRPFNNPFANEVSAPGGIPFRFLFQLFIWQKGTQRPTDPCWSGHFTDFDQKEMLTTGQISVKCDGDFMLLNDATINIQIDPNDGTNPGLDAATFIQGLLANFASSAYFGTPSIPSTMFQLDPTDYTMTKLGDALDITTKIGRDQTSGALYVWFVRTKGNLSRNVVVQLDQDPNVVTGVKFIHLFKDASFGNYLVSTKYRDVFNVVSVFGGYDSNGQQVYGVYEDPTSIAALGAPIEAQLELDAIVSSAAAATYGQIQLDQNSSPTATGSFDLFIPDPKILAGTWVQVWETPQTGSAEATIKQFRVGVVKFAIKAGVITQTCTLQAPTPYLDDAIYRLGTGVAIDAAKGKIATPANAQRLYVIAGGFVSAISSSPATITTTAVEAVFPIAGIVKAAGLTTQPVTDNSGGVNNGQTGDGTYTLSLTSSGAYVITKGTKPPFNTSTQQNLVGIFVLGGTPYVSDIRALAQGNPADDDLLAPTLAAGTTANFIAPVNVGQTTFTQRLQFTLASPTASAPWLSYFMLQVVPATSAGVPLTDATGTELPPSNAVSFSPTATNAYDVSVNLGAGQYYNLQICSVDQYGRYSSPLVLGTTGTHPFTSTGSVPSGASIAQSPFIVNAALAAAIGSTGSHAASVTSGTGLTAGQSLVVDTGANQETVAGISSVAQATGAFTATFATTHALGAPVVPASGSGSVATIINTVGGTEFVTFAMEYAISGTSDASWIDHFCLLVGYQDPSNPSALPVVSTIPATSTPSLTGTITVGSVPLAQSGSSAPRWTYYVAVQACAKDGSYITSPALVWYGT